MLNRITRQTPAAALSIALTMLLASGVNAQEFVSTVKAENGINQAASTSQKRVTSLAQQTSTSWRALRRPIAVLFR
jgi:enoyl reductase-like protein